MSEIKIRDAVPADAMGIAIVQAYTWMTAYRGLMPDAVLQSRVNRVPAQAEYLVSQIGDGNYAVAECAGAIIGFAALSKSRDENYPKDGEIQALYLLQGFHGKKAGRRLFEYCAQKLRMKGCSHLIVNCLNGNPSMGFYLRMGGEIVGERMDTIRGGHIIREKVIRFNLFEEGTTCVY